MDLPSGLRYKQSVVASSAIKYFVIPRSGEVNQATQRLDWVRAGFTCVFWNVNRRDRCSLIVELVNATQADVVVLVEHAAQREQTLDALRRFVEATFVEPNSETSRIQLFARSAALELEEVYGDASGRVTIRSLQIEQTEFLFATAHLPSKINWDRADQTTEIKVLADQIRDVEKRRGHRRTVLVGDFNMNPFEDGVVEAAGLHAMMTRATALAGSRIVQAREYPFFYNPMWGFFGDRTEGPPGTHYYRHSGHLSYEWNIFDQVLVRPDALPWFHDEVEIVTKIGEIELGDLSGRPDAQVASDHFPIVFRLSAPVERG